MLPLLHTEIESHRTEGGLPVVRICFAGVGGSFSEGIHHGNQMREVNRQAIERDQPSGLIIDLRQLEYLGGDWPIWGSVHKRLRSCRTCIVAVGETLEILRDLFRWTNMNKVIPVFQTLEQAEEYVRSEET